MTARAGRSRFGAGKRVEDVLEVCRGRVVSMTTRERGEARSNAIFGPE